ncbi:S-adenosylmethionine-dependent methyltransferase Rv2258c-like [Physella acuta]|uniref:S-adenosylmethionine-dependent methyltransferase Rv2258c-like n=1 Tax=Physella acuta TaxID=109671 RepID=UPI0027DD69AC|nr:S-adenosylmethionine-dependent methyltransferase Rv2258c-like [Physella acuta]
MASTVKNPLQDKLEETIRHTLVGLALSMSYELGILEALVMSDTPMTSQEIADAKQLKERYVRELLNSLVCAQIVDIECHDNGYYYTVDKELSPILLGHSLPNMAGISSVAVRFEPVMKCVRKDGPYGFPYTGTIETVTCLNQVSSLMFNTEVNIILANTPGLKDKLEAGINVIEIGCGMGTFISRLAQRFPASTFTGSDYSNICLEKGREAISALNLPNLSMIQLDVFDIPEEMYGKYDLVVTREVIHCLPDPTLGLTNIRKLLRPGCYYVMTEMGPEDDVMLNKDEPRAAALYSVSAFHCVPQTYLDDTSTTHGILWGKDTTIRYAKESGFRLVGCHPHSKIFVVYILEVDNNQADN